MTNAPGRGEHGPVSRYACPWGERTANLALLEPTRVGMSNYLVAMEAAWLVRDVDNVEDAIGVAVSEAGKRLNDSGKEYVEVNVGGTQCPACAEVFDSAFVAADTALVGLLLEMDVFNADSEEHAKRIAKSEVGGALRDVPLSVVETVLTEEDEDDE